MWKAILKSRAIWGAVLMVAAPQVGQVVNGLVDAIDSHSVSAVAEAAGAAMVVIGRLWAKPILAK